MRRTISRGWIVPILLAALLPVSAWGQSYQSTINGIVTDPTGALVPDVEMTLTSVDTGKVAKTTTGPEGLFSFPNLQPGKYELKATAKGFREYLQRGISDLVNQVARLEVKLELGAETQTIEVTENASPLNFESAVRQDGITPETIKNLPLLVSDKVRSAAAFAIWMPGVNTGSRAEPFDARMNGGLQSGDEAIVDGVSMQQGLMSQSGMITIHGDFQYTPDMVSEVKVLTSNYEPQYGSTTSAQIIANTKSGTNEFHGGAYEFHRNTVLNARQFGADVRPKNLQNDFGAFIGGPAKVPGLWSANKKTYFYVNYEGFRVVGGANRPTITIPSLQERNGDFTDWRDSSGNLIPIYDPATTKFVNGQIVRQQFMGCDGRTPNVICSSDPRLQNSLAKAWFKLVPDPTSSGPVSNYLVPKPVPDSLLANTNYWLIRGDHYYKDNDHFFVS